MKNVITEFLDRTVDRFPNRIAFSDSKREITYSELKNEAITIASSLGFSHKPVAVFLDKSVECICAMFGILYSGNFYSVLDVKSPQERLNKIINTLNPAAVITDRAHESFFPVDTIVYETAERKKNFTPANIIETDPAYVLFTSGSTGEPKGTVVSHRAVVSYADAICRTFSVDETTSWGNQTPLYFSMSVLDVFATVLSGASMHMIPKSYFSFPIKLVEYMNEKKINAIYWVPTALNMISRFDAFGEIKPDGLKKVLFAGEVMPTKVLNYWRRYLPDVMYANLYGPTEVTDTCTYYVVDREFEDTESLPIGIPFDNCDVLLVDGELCVRGPILADGYYNNSAKTAEAFVLNPYSQSYPELIYKTGDIAEYDENGNLLYRGRKDNQIKHMGYRIELGEIENTICASSGVNSCACIYDGTGIILFYDGACRQIDFSCLPEYMRPQKTVKLPAMPINANGKIDRQKLKEMV